MLAACSSTTTTAVHGTSSSAAARRRRLHPRRSSTRWRTVPRHRSTPCPGRRSALAGRSPCGARRPPPRRRGTCCGRAAGNAHHAVPGQPRGWPLRAHHIPGAGRRWKPAVGRLVGRWQPRPVLRRIDRDRKVIEVDLHTGTQTTFTVKDGYSTTPRYTLPEGKAVLLAKSNDVDSPPSLKRVDLAGNDQLTYPVEQFGQQVRARVPLHTRRHTAGDGTKPAGSPSWATTGQASRHCRSLDRGTAPHPLVGQGGNGHRRRLPRPRIQHLTAVACLPSTAAHRRL